jgi:two-component system response regulator
MSQSPKRDSPTRILLVEDDPQDVMLIQKTLKAEMDCRITVAFTQAVFEKELARELPDIIISDSSVRAFDGLTALKVARRKCPEIPFVFCTGNLTEAKQKEAFAMGATNCVSKDNCFAQLARVVKRLGGSGH